MSSAKIVRILVIRAYRFHDIQNMASRSIAPFLINVFLICLLSLSSATLSSTSVYASQISPWYRNVDRVELIVHGQSDLREHPFSLRVRDLREKIWAKVAREIAVFAPNIPVALNPEIMAPGDLRRRRLTLYVRITIRICCEVNGEALGAAIVNVGREVKSNIEQKNIWLSDFPQRTWTYDDPELFRIKTIAGGAEEQVLSFTHNRIREAV